MTAWAACTCTCPGGGSDKKNDFLRGYHIEFGGGRDMPGVGGFDGVCEEHEGYGAALKQKCRSSYGTFIGFSGRGEMIPNENSYCELDPNVVDQVGHSRAALPLAVGRERDEDGRRICRRRSAPSSKPREGR